MSITAHASPPPVSPPPQNHGEEPTGATRHLCTGVHVDEDFRDLVIKEVCTAPSRRAAPSYEFDLVPVMRHAWLSLHLTSLSRSGLIAALAAPCYWGFTVTTLLVAGGYALLVLLDHAWRISKELTRPEEPFPAKKRRKRRPKLPSRSSWKYGQESKRLKNTGTFALVLALTMVVLAFSHPVQGALALYLGCAVALLTAIVGGLRQACINHAHKATALRPRRLSHRERAVDEQQRHPCVVYQRPAHKKDGEDEDTGVFTLFGEESPFIGAGELIHQWNPPMSVQLLRKGSDDKPLHEREHRHPPFKPHELMDHLRAAVTDLRDDHENFRLPAQVRDRIYVSQSDVSVDRSILWESVDPAAMRRIIDRQDSAHHHFLEVSVPDAGGELVATVLFQLRVRGRTLILVFAACVLTHTPDSFRKGEEFGQQGKRAIVGAAWHDLLRFPRHIRSLGRITRYPFYLARALSGLLHRALALRGVDFTLVPRRNSKIGSRISIRQEPAEDWSKVQLDKTTLLGHIKNVENRLLKATGDFLDSRGVDISDFDDRALQIINSGIVNMGGTNDFGNTVFGDQVHPQAQTSPPGPGNPQNG
ncbi:hypothetical protein ACWGSK_20590 [Nocardiopsis sp. NPDC055551]